MTLLRGMAVSICNKRTTIRLHAELQRDRGSPKSYSCRGREPKYDGAAQA